MEVHNALRAGLIQQKMKTKQGEVLIFKALTDSAEGDDPYRTKLEEAGFHTLSVPVLDFEYCNLNELQQNIKNPSNFSGKFILNCIMQAK